MKKVSIRKYGARLCSDHEAVIVDAMRAQNRLWNALVETEHKNTAEYHQIVNASDATLAALVVEHDAGQKALDTLISERNRLRAAKRSKKLEGSTDYAGAIKEGSLRLKELRGQMKACRTRAKEAAKPKLEELETKRRAAVKDALATAEMWWCHSELVTNAFDIARSRAMKSNAQLRFHRFVGEGRIGVRFSPGLVLSNPRQTNFFKLRAATLDELGCRKAERPNKRIMAVDIQVGNAGEGGIVPVATFLVTIQAGMDVLADTPLKTITVKREMHAGRPKWFVVLMFVDADAEDEVAPLPAMGAGIDFGWRMVRDREWGDDTGLRVATIAYTDGKKEHINLPPEFMRRLARADRLRGRLDEAGNDFWRQAAPLFTDDVLEKMDESEWLRVLVSKARRARNAYPSLMMTICQAHEKNPVLGSLVDDQFQAWARQAKKLETAAFGVRHRALDHRKHIFRNVAARLVRSCGLLAFKNTNFADLSKLEKDNGEENELHQKARANRFAAAPSELRAAILQAAQKVRCEVKPVDPQNTTVTCSSCGHVHAGPISDLTFVCDGCSAVHDQVENSAQNCLNDALESST